MVRKTKTKDKPSSNKASKNIKPDSNKEDEKDNFIVLVKSKAKKVSPKSDDSIEFELVKDEEGLIYLRLTKNDSGGNFCKTPVLLQSIIDVLNKQTKDEPFNSRVMKDVFQGKGSKNANNTSFLMAALRSKDMGLAIADKDKPISSILSPELKSQSEKLLKMS